MPHATVVRGDSNPAKLRSTIDYDAVLARQVQQSIADREENFSKVSSLVVFYSIYYATDF